MSGGAPCFSPGVLVSVTRGRHAGAVFAVIEGANDSDRVLIADGKLVSARKPKRKNLKHLAPAGHLPDDRAGRIAGGKPVDDGWLAEAISRAGIGGGRAPQRELASEEAGSSECRKTTS